MGLLMTCSHVYDKTANGVRDYAYCALPATIDLVGVPYCELHAVRAAERVLGNYLTL
jgi:hypothetical protein